MKNVQFLGTGSYLPSKILSNSDIEQMVDTSDEWISSRTGIKNRRIAGTDETSSSLGANAAKSALKDAGVPASEIDMIVVATSTPDMFFPSTACLIQRDIGASAAFAFDISAACSGFVYGITIAEQFIKSGKCKNILVIGTEIMSRIVDWTDRNTCILFGDGAGAVVLGETKNDNGIISSALNADGRHHDFIEVPGGGSRHPFSEVTVANRLNFIRMKGNETFKFAIKHMTDSIKKVITEAGMKLSDIDHFIPHQANYRILNSVADKLGLPREKLVMNLENFGNTSAASIPIALDEVCKNKKINKGDIILLCGFGSGLTWGSVLIKW